MIAHELTDFKSVLEQCFSADPELINRWHICAGEGLKACVTKTHADLIENDVRFFAVFEAEELAGYFGKEEVHGLRFLTGFFLLPKFRNEASRLLFWDLIEAHFEKPFYCGLFEKNIPAKKFIYSRGGRPVRSVTTKDGGAVYYEIGV